MFGRRRGHRWTLTELNARWLTVPDPRYNVGFDFDCPVHRKHRLTVRFDSPYDGFGPVDGPGLLVRMVDNGSLDQVTLTTPGGYEILDFNHVGPGACGRYRILEGVVERVRFSRW